MTETTITCHIGIYGRRTTRTVKPAHFNGDVCIQGRFPGAPAETHPIAEVMGTTIYRCGDRFFADLTMQNGAALHVRPRVYTDRLFTRGVNHFARAEQIANSVMIHQNRALLECGPIVEVNKVATPLFLLHRDERDGPTDEFRTITALTANALGIRRLVDDVSPLSLYDPCYDQVNHGWCNSAEAIAASALAHPDPRTYLEAVLETRRGGEPNRGLARLHGRPPITMATRLQLPGQPPLEAGQQQTYRMWSRGLPIDALSANTGEVGNVIETVTVVDNRGHPEGSARKVATGTVHKDRALTRSVEPKAAAAQSDSGPANEESENFSL